MDYVDGCTLNSYLQRVRFMTIDEVMRLVNEIGGALAYCHEDIYRFLMSAEDDHLERAPEDAGRYVITPEKERELIAKYGVTHNDLHSGNIMRRDYDGGFVMLDFGLAIQDGRSVKSSSRRDGALEYRAPEKWDDANVITPQSDVYSLGIILYEALAGRVPFVYDPSLHTNELENINDIYHAHLETTPPPIEPLRRAAFEATHPGRTWVKDYPDWLEQIIMKCLAKRPEDRFATAKQFMNAYNEHKQLQEIVTGHLPVKVDDGIQALTTRLHAAEQQLVEAQTKLRSATRNGTSRSSRMVLWIMGLLIALLVAATATLGYAYMNRDRQQQQSQALVREKDSIIDDLNDRVKDLNATAEKQKAEIDSLRNRVTIAEDNAAEAERKAAEQAAEEDEENDSPLGRAVKAVKKGLRID